MVMTGGWFSWHWVYHITIHGNMFGILYMHMELWYHNWTYHFDMNGGFISSWEWTMKWPSSFWMPKKLMSSPLTMEHLIITKPWVIFFNVHVGWKTNIFFEHGFKMWLPVVTSFLVAVLSPPIFTGAFWFGPGILVVKGCEMGQDWGTPPSVFSIGNRVLDVGWPPRGLASSSGVWIYMIYMEEARDSMDSFFPECVARVPVSLWGSGGWGCVRSTLRSLSATVRNRPQPFARSPYGRAYGKFCRGGSFWRFQTSGCFVSRGRRGTSWHSDVFCNVSKVVLRGRRNTFATFSEDVLQFSWQAQHFGRVHRHFSWQAQHFRRVLLRVFCKSHWQGCVKWRQGANSVAGVAFSHMCWKLTEASHETSILRLQIFRF